jgi:putative ABC transport system permease protein
LSTLVSEAARIAVSSPVTSGVVLLIVAGVCGIILATTGQTVRAEDDVLARIDEAGTRLIVAIDDHGNAGVHTEAVQRVAGLSGIEWVIGLGFAQDGRSSQLGQAGTPTPVRSIWGDVPSIIDVNGRLPLTGEGIVGTDGARALGLSLGVGGVDLDDMQIAIVGSFEAKDPLQGLNHGVLTRADTNESVTLRSIYILVQEPEDVEAMTAAVATVLGADDPTAVRFQTSATLAEVRAAVAGELGRYGRVLILGALASGLLLITIVIYGSVTLRRQDFGRRRALGAHRSSIVGLVATQYAVVATIGLTIGITVGTLLVDRWTGAPPNPRFVIAVALLTLITTLAASLPPALVAAYRDPVRALRVP